MRRLQQFMAGLLLLVCTHPYAGPTLAGPKEARAFSDMVMSKVAAGDLDEAIAEVKKYTIVPAVEIDSSLGQFKYQLPVIAQRFGASVGTEFVREDKVGESLLRVTYLHRFDKHAMRWMFYFYRGSQGWVLNTFRFDDNIVVLFP